MFSTRHAILISQARVNIALCVGHCAASAPFVVTQNHIHNIYIYAMHQLAIVSTPSTCSSTHRTEHTLPEHSFTTGGSAVFSPRARARKRRQIVSDSRVPVTNEPMLWARPPQLGRHRRDRRSNILRSVSRLALVRRSRRARINYTISCARVLCMFVWWRLCVLCACG